MSSSVIINLNKTHIKKIEVRYAFSVYDFCAANWLDAS